METVKGDPPERRRTNEIALRAFCHVSSISGGGFVLSSSSVPTLKVIKKAIDRCFLFFVFFFGFVCPFPSSRSVFLTK